MGLYHPQVTQKHPLPITVASQSWFATLQVAPLILKYIEKFLDIILKTKLVPLPFIFDSALYHIQEEMESKLC